MKTKAEIYSIYENGHPSIWDTITGTDLTFLYQDKVIYLKDDGVIIFAGPIERILIKLS